MRCVLVLLLLTFSASAQLLVRVVQTFSVTLDNGQTFLLREGAVVPVLEKTRAGYLVSAPQGDVTLERGDGEELPGVALDSVVPGRGGMARWQAAVARQRFIRALQLAYTTGPEMTLALAKYDADAASGQELHAIHEELREQADVLEKFKFLRLGK